MSMQLYTDRKSLDRFDRSTPSGNMYADLIQSSTLISSLGDTQEKKVSEFLWEVRSVMNHREKRSNIVVSPWKEVVPIPQNATLIMVKTLRGCFGPALLSWYSTVGSGYAGIVNLPSYRWRQHCNHPCCGLDPLLVVQSQYHPFVGPR